MDHVEFLQSKPTKFSPIGWVGNRVPFAPRGFEGSKANGVGVGFAVSGKARSEDVDMMALVSKLVYKELDADADSVKDGPNAIRKNGNAKWLHAPCTIVLVGGAHEANELRLFPNRIG